MPRARAVCLFWVTALATSMVTAGDPRFTSYYAPMDPGGWRWRTLAGVFGMAGANERPPESPGCATGAGFWE